jgi:hypothetical protein
MSKNIIRERAHSDVIQYLYQIMSIVVAMSKTQIFTFPTNLTIAMIVFVIVAISLSNEFNAQAATSKNSTISSTGNTTRGLASTNNVTTSAGNNGHIYRGGAATGSGGE